MNNLVVTAPKQVPQELNNGGTSTSETVFVSSATISALNPVASAPVVCPLPSGGQIAGLAATSGFNAAFTAGKSGAQRVTTRFRVLAFGRVAAGASHNATILMAYGTSATVASNTSIATSGAVALTTAIGKTNWFLECHLVYDADSQDINGYFSGQLHTTRVAPTTITNPVTNIDLNSAGQTLGFVVSATFSGGSVNNKCYLDGFFLLID